MPIKLAELESAASRIYRTRISESLDEAIRKKQQTAFLCHSHKDEELAKGLQVLLFENGWDVYIDWQDTTMPEKPDKTTARKIKNKISELDWFLFLATPNSTTSRWCPWEIGYADRAKAHDQIIIIPTTDHSGRWYGNEYLQLYRQISLGSSGNMFVFEEDYKNMKYVDQL